MRRLVWPAILIVVSGCSQLPHTNTNGAVEPTGRILRHGVFSKVSGGDVIASTETTTGKALSKLVMTFIRETDRIPIKKDTIIGYQYRLSNLPDVPTVELRRVLQHPPFTLPDGSVTTGSDYMIRKRVERSEVFAYDVYALNEDYEMVGGEWNFQIWFKDKLLLERKFTTYHESETKAGNEKPSGGQ